MNAGNFSVGSSSYCSTDLDQMPPPLQIDGYTITQINGCRILEKTGHLEPEKGSEVYVSNIPDEIYEDKLYPIFSRVGPIHRLRLMVCFSGSPKGYGYVQYENPKVAMIAIRTLNGCKIGRSTLHVTKSRDNCRLYFGNIPKDKSRQEVEIELAERMNDIVEIFFYSNPNDLNRSRGFVFVEFSSHRSAAIARRKCANQLILWGNKINVDWAEDEEDVPDAKLLQLTELYLRCIPATITDNDIKFEIRNTLDQEVWFQVKKINDFAFIQFTNHEIAERALSLLKCVVINGYRFNISWANPTKRAKAPKAEARSLKPVQDKTSGRSAKMQEFNITNQFNPMQPQTIQPIQAPLERQFLLHEDKSEQAQTKYLQNDVGKLLSSSNSMYRVADNVLYCCKYKLYEALKLFVTTCSWGKMHSTITTDIVNGSVLYSAELWVPDAPDDIRALFKAAKYTMAKSEKMACEVKALFTWKSILPFLDVSERENLIYQEMSMLEKSLI